MKPQSLHHIAYKCADPEKTRAFYEDVLGLPMVLTLELSRKPSTGEPEAYYFHFFFEMADKSCIAFFDLADDEMPERGANVPIWTNHLALKVNGLEELQAAKENLERAGVQVDAEIDHDFCRSIYFFDPNGIRLEITADTHSEGFSIESRANARINFDNWLARRKELTPAA